MRIVLAEIIDRYLDHLKFEQQASPTTCSERHYALYRLHDYLEAYFGLEKVDANQIEAGHLRSYLAHLHNRGCQPSTIAYTVSVLRTFFAYALAGGYLEGNPAEKLKKPKQQQKERPYLTMGEMEALLRAVSPGETNYLRNLNILLTFYYTGIRLEELINIKCEDLSPDLTELKIVKGKGDRSRLLPVHPGLSHGLSLYLDQEHPGTVYLFVSQKGTPLSKTTIYRLVKGYGEKAGLTSKPVTPHILRHTFATHLYQQDVDIYRVSVLLGHTNIENTAIYTHADEAKLREAMLKL